MNGPAHYRKAGQVLAQVEDRDVSAAMVAVFTAVAQVHALLALTAATVGRGGFTLADRHEWLMAIDPEYAAGQAAPLCRAHPDDCPNGPGPHAYYNPPELEGRCPCCVQPGDSAQPTGGTS